MSKSKLGRDELLELNQRVKILQEHKMVISAIELQIELWKAEQLRKKGLNTRNEYQINLKTGAIKVVKPPKVESGAEEITEDEGN